MKIERNIPRRRNLRQIMSAFLVFVLAFGMVMTVPGLSGAARAVDFNAACSLNVQPGNQEQSAELAGKLRIDLYQVAQAKPVEGQDTYIFEFLPGFEEAERLYKDESPDWAAVAQKAAEYVFAEDSGIQAAASGMAQTDISVPACGLYLVIARGEELEVNEYLTTVKQRNGAGEVEERIATTAYSDTHIYTYAPELAAVPGRQIAGTDGTIQNTTGGNGPWIYRMAVTLKPEETPRYGKLEIIKQLGSYEMSREATFIFQVDAVLNGENVYSNVIPVTFTSAGEKKVLVDRIPAGAQVTVEEIYSGANYKVESAKLQMPQQTISVQEVVSVTFVNNYDETDNGGGAIINHFEYSDLNGWGLDQIEEDMNADRT